jgi:hypothetical protein
LEFVAPEEDCVAYNLTSNSGSLEDDALVEYIFNDQADYFIPDSPNTTKTPPRKRTFDDMFASEENHHNNSPSPIPPSDCVPPTRIHTAMNANVNDH